MDAIVKTAKMAKNVLQNGRKVEDTMLSQWKEKKESGTLCYIMWQRSRGEDYSVRPRDQESLKK